MKVSSSINRVCKVNGVFECNNPANICWSSRRVEDIFKTCLEEVFNTSSVLQFYVFQDVLKTSYEYVLKTSWRRFLDLSQVVLKTYSRRLERPKIVTLKTSWRRLEDMSWRRLEDISWRRVQDVSEGNKIFTGDICI